MAAVSAKQSMSAMLGARTVKLPSFGNKTSIVMQATSVVFDPQRGRCTNYQCSRYNYDM